MKKNKLTYIMTMQLVKYSLVFYVSLVSYVNRDVSRTTATCYCHLVEHHSFIVPTMTTRFIEKFHANRTHTLTYATDYMEHGPCSISSPSIQFKFKFIIYQ